MVEEALANLHSVARRVAVAARYLDDFSRLGEGRETRVEESFPAASVIKIGIMSCLLDEVQRGRLQLSERVAISAEQQVGGAGVLFELEPDREFRLDELCRLMMVVSDNTASNALARCLGLDRLNAFWASREYGSRMARYFMDPVVDGRDNAMTALGAARMLADLYKGRDLDPLLREFAVGCLRRQQYREKIPLMLPDHLVVGHKTGELDGVRHDAATIEAERPYILVVLTAMGAETWRVDEAIARFSLALYQGTLAGAKNAGA